MPPATANTTTGPRTGGKSFQIIGLDEINQLFQNLPAAFNQIFQNATREYAANVYRDAQAKVPVVTGRLKRSIGQQVGQTETQIYAATPYAAIVDQGWGGRRKPKPYLTGPAVQYESLLLDAIGNGITSYLKSGSTGGGGAV